MDRFINTVQHAVDRVASAGNNLMHPPEQRRPSATVDADQAGIYHPVTNPPREELDHSSSTSTIDIDQPPSDRSAAYTEQQAAGMHGEHGLHGPHLASDVNVDNVMATAKNLAVGAFKEGYGWMTGDREMHAEGKEQRVKAAGGHGYRRI